VTSIFVQTQRGLALGQRLAAELQAALHVRAPIKARDASCFSSLKEVLPGAFAGDEPLVVLASTGIVVRLLAPHLSDKRQEPPVVIVAEDGSSVIPLLGGHRGANTLARRIAALTGACAAITTGGDLAFGVALDSPPDGWTLANPEDASPAMAALLNGAAASIEGVMPWLAEARLPTSGTEVIRLTATIGVMQGSGRHLVYHPRSLALGIGCERGVPPSEAVSAMERALTEAGIAPQAVGAVVSLDLKADEEAVHAVAARLDCPARFFDADQLLEQTHRLANPSETVFRAVGCYGVAEGAAIAAVGRTGTLLVPKKVLGRVTLAIAEGTAPLDPDGIGRARGHLAIVGIGPGSAAMRSPEVDAALAAAEDWVGYGLYLDLAGRSDAVQHRFGLGEEEARTAHALRLAGSGRRVVLVCSGDAGIYAMASLAFELLDRHADVPAWQAIRRAAITVMPGISAMQAAAARAGAPLGHDFCAISLSDLMTPWHVIRRRVEAAAAGDFVIAFYNPVSRRRRHQLAEAKEILLQQRTPETPVVVASNLGRPAEAVRHTTLATLDPDQVDMLTLVLVGASSTRRIGRWIYTPRGYGDREPGAAS
jgi:cobalt-precorrin 5A hydrolase / precorrin-3B C17-methyltransferase